MQKNPDGFNLIDGNMTQDLNRDITDIDYNVLNLPSNIYFGDNSSIRNKYTADGVKCQNTAFISNSWLTPIGSNPSGLTTYTTEYCGNLVYKLQVGQATKQYLYFDGGYVTFDGTTPKYHFYVQDHLGNNRAVVSQTGAVEQQTQYYPSGAIMTDISSGLSQQPYLYSGKELDRMHGLDWYDYGARHYDAALLRWHTVDPLCEKYYHISPYAFCANNFVNLFDPDGKRPTANEAAIMAGYVYHDEKIDTYREMLDKTHWHVVDNLFSIDTNQTAWYQNGLQSQIFAKTENGITEYAYVFAGTNSITDVVQDSRQILGLSEQYSAAISNASILSENLSGSELTFIGHSLGGGEAAAASMATGRAAITFNPAAVSPATIFFNGLGDASNVTNYRTTGKSIGLGIFIGGDPVSNIQDNLGFGAPGYTILVPLDKPVLSHQIFEFTKHNLPER